MNPLNSNENNYYLNQMIMTRQQEENYNRARERDIKKKKDEKEKQRDLLAKYTDKSVWTTRDKLADPVWEEFNKIMAEKLRPINYNISQLKSIIQDSEAWLNYANQQKKDIPEKIKELKEAFNEIVVKEENITLNFLDSINPSKAGNPYSYYQKRVQKNQLKKQMEELRKEYKKNSEDLDKLTVEIKKEKYVKETFADSPLKKAQEERKEIIKLISRQFYDEIEPIITAHFKKQLLKWKEKSIKSKLGGKTKKKRRRRTKKKRKRTKKRRRKRRTKKRRRRRR